MTNICLFLQPDRGEKGQKGERGDTGLPGPDGVPGVTVRNCKSCVEKLHVTDMVTMMLCKTSSQENICPKIYSASRPLPHVSNLRDKLLISLGEGVGGGERRIRVGLIWGGRAR